MTTTETQTHGDSSLADLGLLRLMVVDDDADVRQLVADSLADRYEVVTCTHGLEAMERVDRIEPDIIVMDVMMPGLNGIDAVRAIKKDFRHAATPVLFLTAKTDNATMREGLGAGGDVFYEKPFVPSQLLERIKRLARDHRVRPLQKSLSLEQLAEQFRGAVPQKSAPPATEPEIKHRPAPAAMPAAVGKHPVSGLAAPPLADAAALPPRLRILAIDDDPDILEYMRTILRDRFEIVVTPDSETAPDKIMTYQPDILLLDIQMPRLNGMHLAMLIRVNKRLRGARVIFVSSKNDRETIARAWKLGASEFVDKPFTPEQLLRKIEDVVRHPDFQRIKKRLDYREVLRREGVEA